MPVISIGGKTECTRVHRLAHRLAHLLHFAVSRFALGGLLTHDKLAHGDMADNAADIDADVTLKLVQVVAVALPTPRHAFFQRNARNRFDAYEAFDDCV